MVMQSPCLRISVAPVQRRYALAEEVEVLAVQLLQDAMRQ